MIRRGEMIKMTKAEALKIQAEQVQWYSRFRSDLAEAVAAVTTADALQDGIEYPVAVINKCILMGGEIERLCGLDPNRFED